MHRRVGWRGRGPLRALGALGALTLAAGAALAQPAPLPPPEALANRFNDPFVQATDGLAACPLPAPPGVTEAEFREQAHWRAQRGNSCWLAGRCRLPNAYLYDAEIIPRVARALQADGRFGASSSVWAAGQRRWVWLQGCVASAEQAAQIVQRVRDIDDVEAVIDELMVGTAGPPPYRTAPRQGAAATDRLTCRRPAPASRSAPCP
ncbi:MAG: transporter [Burkholderiales bacterium PBB5]|nr:MAG: transporter [Burkholderiales bacterium PBB5]